MAGHTRIAIIGVGGMGIANYHAQTFLATAKAEIVGICDVKPEALSTFGERFRVPPALRYDDHHAMLAAVRPVLLT